MEKKRLYYPPTVEKHDAQMSKVLCASGDIESAALWGIVNAQENDLTMLGFE